MKWSSAHEEAFAWSVLGIIVVVVLNLFPEPIADWVTRLFGG